MLCNILYYITVRFVLCDAKTTTNKGAAQNVASFQFRSIKSRKPDRISDKTKMRRFL
jgi:hypothetical protein